jgi:hypothetical protein
MEQRYSQLSLDERIQIAALQAQECWRAAQRRRAGTRIMPDREEARQARAGGRGGAHREFVDPAFLTDAFRGADAVYTLLPTDQRSPDYRAQQDLEGATILTAVRNIHVYYVCTLSSLGADSPRPTGVIRGWAHKRND